MKGKLKSGKVLKCNPPNTQCGLRCLEPAKDCSDSGPKTKEAIDQLFATKPRQLLKAAKVKGFGPIQYITQQEALRAYAVYKGADIFAIKKGEIAHPYIKMSKIEQSVVDKYHDKLKADKASAVLAAKASGKKAPFTLYDRLAKAGIRGDNPKVSTEEKVKIFIKLYMEQNGQSFATGNRLNLNRLVVDHVIPLTAGGKNSAENMVLIESNINYWKKAIPTQKDMALALERKIQAPASPELLKSYTKAIVSGNKTEADKLQKQIILINKTGAKNLDRAQTQAYKAGAKEKATTAATYDGLRWAKFNTAESLNNLNAKEVRQLLKVQAKESGTVRGWLKNRATQEQVELAPANVQKAQIFLTNGGKWKDMPDSWKDAFKERYLTNQHPKGNAAIKMQYGGSADAPDWLK